MINEVEQLRGRLAEMEASNKQLEKALKESEERFFKIFHASSNPTSITTLKEGRVVDLNEASARIGGFTREELIGRFSPDLYPHGRSGKRDLIKRKIQEEGRVHNMEMDLLSKSGDIRTVLMSLDPISINDESCLLSVAVDLTERKQAEDMLKESLEDLNRVINCIGDPIFVKDHEFRHVLVNEAMCSWTGKRREEFLGRTAHEVFPEDKENIDVLLENEMLIFKTGKESLTEDELRGPQGQNRTVSTRKTMLVDRKGNKHIIGIVRDITELKRLEAQLQQAQKMEAVGVLASGVAHDFNNLLTVILGVSEMLLLKLSQHSPLREDIEEIMKAGKQAASLTSQLLAFSRKQIISPRILDLNDTIQDMSQMLRRMLGEDIELVFQGQPGPGPINADPSQIQQILMNLAGNSRDAMPRGGRLTIETADMYLDEEYVRQHAGVRAGHYVMLAVGDNGEGMDKETQARIFEPFFTTKAPGKGTGLGLSTVYGIVKQNDGYIWVYSEPGKGTTVKIYFPRAQGEASKPAASSKSEDKFLEGKTLLVVEDDEPVRNLACRILRGLGCRVLEASDGTQALFEACAYQGEINLVMTDVVMPGINGKDLVSRLEEIRPGIKALYVSGYTDNAIVHHGLLDSDVAFLQKPFTIESLSNKILEVICSEE